MDIAIDVRCLMEGRMSGVEQYTTQIIRGLLRVAPQHTYHLFSNSAHLPKLPDFGSAVSWHIFRYPNKAFNALQWAAGYPRWDALVPADCFFVPNFRLLPLAAGMPLVTTVHDLSFEHFPYFFNWRRRLWHVGMKPAQLMARSTALLAVSQHTASDLQHLYGINPAKISVVYSGVEKVLPLSKATLQAVRARYRLPERFVLFIGALEPRKNIPGIIEAFSAIASRVPHHLVIAGQRGWLTREIDRAWKDSPASARIHFPGFIQEADKTALYQAADLFVYPSFYEGFGFPPLEALAAGTPVITSANSSLPEVVGEWAVLVDPYNISELALVMQELLIHKPVISEEVRQTIATRYNWDEAAKQTAAVIAKAAGAG